MDHERACLDQSKLAGGDEGEWKKLIAEFWPLLLKQAYRVVHNESHAEDIVQHVVQRLWEGRAQIIHIESIRYYLFRMTQNTAVSELRSRQRLKEVPFSCLPAERYEFHSQADDPQVILQGQERQERILQLVLVLSGPQRRVVECLQSSDGMSTRKIGKVIGCSCKNVQTLLRRIRDRLEPVTQF